MTNLCKNCSECKTYNYLRENKNGELQSFKYCKGNKEYVDLSKWYIKKDGYAHSTGKINGKRRLFHTLMKPEYEDGLVMDHINGERDDNRLVNLRLVTPGVNVQNYHNMRTSRFPGVYYNHKKNKWISQVRIGKKQVGKRTFNSELEAYDYYVKTMKKHNRPLDTDSHEYYLYCEWLSEQSQTTLI